MQREKDEMEMAYTTWPTLRQFIEKAAEISLGDWAWMVSRDDSTVLLPQFGSWCC